MGCIVILIGTITGLVGGFFGGYMARIFGMAPTMEGQAFAGALFGGVVGTIMGTLGGDPNKSTTIAGSGGARFFLAMFSGAIAGALGGSKFEILRPLLQILGIPIPS